MSKFKLPSFNYIIDNGMSSLVRFPFVIASALLFAIIGCYMVDHNQQESIYLALLMSSAFGVPLFFAIHTFLESKSFNFIQKAIAYLLGISILALLFYMLPRDQSTFTTQMPYVRYAIFSMTIHLIISFSPFLRADVNNGFWQFNRSLFVRVFLAQFYALVLFAGISGAVLAVEKLFEVEVDDKLYMYLWIIHASIINIWIFVGGIERKVNELEDLQEYPKGLKIFALYILFPIALIYFVILYAYILKILINWDWPKGLVSYLVIGVSGLAYLTSLLLYPYFKLSENNSINAIRRGLFIAVIPLTLVLFFAIGIRISNYGLTINRYLILVVGVWLFLSSIYNSFNINRIKSIPISLALFGIVISFGSWGAASLSEKSQVKRLSTILVDAKILNSDKNKLLQEFQYQTDTPIYPNKVKPSITDSTYNEIRSILNYLDDYHRFNKIKHWFSQDIDSLAHLNSNLDEDQRSYMIESDAIVSIMGLDLIRIGEEYYPNLSFYANTQEAIQLGQYDYMIPKQLVDYVNTSDLHLKGFQLESRIFEYGVDKEHQNFILKEKGNILLTIDLKDFINSLDRANFSKENIARNKLSISGSSEQVEMMIYFDYLNLRKEPNSNYKIENFEALFLLKLK